ncbi:hypothetical protein EYF80_010294 [Liparis tanakae]|uniref:Uncharacterized protein n=1 Tax=Liparis tanakae TaxID=230148 RepID=A0A4Z2IN46_9TELE|nr:hypothetical protein EYF80_010294 [Liparis tanakae]
MSTCNFTRLKRGYRTPAISSGRLIAPSSVSSQAHSPQNSLLMYSIILAAKEKNLYERCLFKSAQCVIKECLVPWEP